jgi:dienelactone hydrolase
MKNKRRDFIKITGAAGLGIAGNIFNPFSSKANVNDNSNILATANSAHHKKEVSVIGAYGPWAASLISHDLPSLSFRRNEFNDIDAWRNKARQRVADRLNIPNIGQLPKVTVKKEYQYDGLHIEELSWQLPYGDATEAILLKPLNAKGKLPGILAFHDHGGNKYFGRRKITKTSDKQHPLMVTHQDHYYEGTAWANEIAKHGYVVLVSDAFAFASRRVMLEDVTEKYRRGVTDDNPEQVKSIEAYNKWASEHEHIMAKSLFCAGTTWPGVFFAEDQKALDILCAREDVDADRIGCGGLSGGGIRTDFMGGLDPRIKCAVTVGFMTTWQDFLLNKSPTHTWMTFVPLLPNELDFPEILGLRTPLPTMVLNDENDQLYTLQEMKQADKILQEIYTKANASSHYKSSYYPGLHKFDKQMQSDAFDWFDKWLKS